MSSVAWPGAAPLEDATQAEPQTESADDQLKPVMLKLNDPSLHRNQIRAINTLIGHARVLSREARPRVVAKVGAHIADTVQRYLAETAPIIIHFRPTLLEKFLKDTCYRSLFEVMQGNSTREKAESTIFLGIYDGGCAFERPKYGSVNTMNHPSGNKPAASYGECYLVLRDSVRIRCTCTPCDSFGTAVVGVMNYCMHVIEQMDVVELNAIAQIAKGEIAYGDPTACNIFTYREVQIHGELRFDRDFSAVVMPEYLRPQYGESVKRFARTNGLELRWCQSFIQGKAALGLAPFVIPEVTPPRRPRREDRELRRPKEK